MTTKLSSPPVPDERGDPAHRVRGGVQSHSDPLLRPPAAASPEAHLAGGNDLNALFSAWKNESDANVRLALTAALVDLLSSAQDCETVAELLQADECTDTLRSQVACRASAVQCRRIAVASIRDADALVELARIAEDADTRIAAEERARAYAHAEAVVASGGERVALSLVSPDTPTVANESDVAPVPPPGFDAVATGEPTALPTGVVTFLFTDIEGSTRLWESFPDAMRVALARHDVLLRHCIRDFRGSIFKTGGDAFYAVFAQVADGVAAALSSQVALSQEDWPPGARIKVRMALHTGEGHLREGDYFGPALNRVARVLSTAHGGQTVITSVTHHMVSTQLPDGASARLLGEFALKDLPQPQPIYQLCQPPLPDVFPPLRTWRSEQDESVPSIAVLPFVNMSRDEENEYFADGLSEELLNVLSKIKGLRVASRTSSFKFKGTDVDLPVAAQKLGVAHVLEGSVRKAGKRVRITAQLVKVSSDSHLWSETYNRELDDIFAVQDDIAQSVVQELRERLLSPTDGAADAAKVIADVQAASKGRSDNPEAFRLYLQGQFFRSHLTRESLANAVECYEGALALDPDYALAWAGLSRVASDQAGQNWVPREEGYEKARRAAQMAIAFEPKLAEAHTALGWVLWAHDWKWSEAEASFHRALELAPGSTLAINAAATLVGNLGNLEEAIGLFRRAVQLDPLNVSFNRNLGLYSLAAGLLEEAETALKRTVHISPQGGMTHCWRSIVRVRQGRLDEALADVNKESSDIFRLVASAVVHFARGDLAASDAALAELIETQGADSPYQVAEVYAARGDADQAFEWLDRTYRDRDPGLSYMKMDPLLVNVRADPRWDPLLVRMKLA